MSGKHNAKGTRAVIVGAGTHPGGGVTGAPGYNAARAILKEM